MAVYPASGPPRWHKCTQTQIAQTHLGHSAGTTHTYTHTQSTTSTTTTTTTRWQCNQRLGPSPGTNARETRFPYPELLETIDDFIDALLTPKNEAALEYCAVASGTNF
eukprot:1159539-Pelagomonas_calceolata.AAC.5